jgi:hypothetical protein
MRFIRNDFFQKHLDKHVKEEVKEEARQIQVGEIVEPAAETSFPAQAGVISVDAVPEEPKEVFESVVPFVVSDSVELHFQRPIEIYINGKPYIGKTVKAPTIEIAAEIVRIAREAYGRSIVA